MSGVCFDGMRRNACKSAERLVSFLEEHRDGDIVKFEVNREAIDVINEAYSNLRGFCFVKGEIEDFLDIDDPKFFAEDLNEEE